MADARPRFRRDLEARPIEIDGVSYVEATDLRSGTHFRFYDFEHAVAEALDGRPLGEIVPEARERTGIELTADQLATFTERLHELGFLEAGDDDATHSGPAPIGMLSIKPAPAAAAPTVPAGSTERLPLLGKTDEVLPLEAGPEKPVPPEKPEPPVEEPPAKKAPAEEPPSPSLPPVEEPPAETPPIGEPGKPGPERKVTRELVSRVSPLEPEPEPAPRRAPGEPVDLALASRAGELSSHEPRPAALSSELSPPGEAQVVAPDLDDDDEETRAFLRPGDDDEPTATHRRPDDKKGTLFGVPFEEMDAMVSSARATRAEATPPPVTLPREEAPAPAVPTTESAAKAEGAGEIESAAKADVPEPSESAAKAAAPATSPAEPPAPLAEPEPPAPVAAKPEAPVPAAALAPTPSSPFPPAVEAAPPFPKSATPAPSANGVSSARSEAPSAEVPATRKSAELPVLARSAELPVLPKPAEAATARKSAELPALAKSAEAPAARKSAELPTLVKPAEAPAARKSAELPTLVKPAEAPAARKSAELPALVKPAEVPALAKPAEVPALATSAEVPPLAPGTPAPTRRRLPPVVFAAAGVAAAAAIGFFGFRLSSTSQPGPIAVRTVVPLAGSTYRWFETPGTVKQAGERTLTFTTGGRVIRVLSAGTSFAAGDIIAEVQGAPQIKGALEHNKQRLAYYEQRLADMQKANNRPEIRQAELKIAEKKRLIAEAEAGLTRQGVIATTSGEISQPLVVAGDTVKAGAPAVKVKGTDWRAEFELSRDDADRARHLGFCRVEIEGKPHDCSLSAEGGDETHVFVDLPSEPGLAAGKPVRLAKARFDDVFVLPATALAPTKGSDRRVYVVKDGRAESYAVVLADQTPTEIVVSQGLEPGSAVVAEVPPALRARAAVKATPAK